MRSVPSQLAAKLYAAGDLIAEQGLDSTTIEQIADATGVPKATLYYYFSGKEDILAFLFADLLSLIAGDVAVAVGGPGTARDRLEAVVSAQLSGMFEHPSACRALIGDLGRAGRLPELAAAIDAAFNEPLGRLLREGVGDGSLRQLEDVEGAVSAIFGAVTMTGLGYLVKLATQDQTGAARLVASILLDGLAPA